MTTDPILEGTTPEVVCPRCKGPAVLVDCLDPVCRSQHLRSTAPDLAREVAELRRKVGLLLEDAEASDRRKNALWQENAELRAENERWRQSYHGLKADRGRVLDGLEAKYDSLQTLIRDTLIPALHPFERQGEDEGVPDLALWPDDEEYLLGVTAGEIRAAVAALQAAREAVP